MFSKIFSILRNEENDLLSLTAVSSLIKPSSEQYKGVKPVPIAAIVGSEGRYRDFTKHFLPRFRHMKSRWDRINQAYGKGIELPPVKLYEIGGVYFVRDGNHRVSVALQRGVEYIDAEVTSLTTDIKLHENLTMEELTRAVIAYEKKNFLKKTKLNKYRSDASLEFTTPGRYDEAYEHILVHKYYLNLDKQYEIPLKDAVISWYDNVYLPIVTIIKEENVLARFPDRTASDLYIWVVKYWDDLKKKYGNQYPTKRAVLKFSEKYGKGFWEIVKEKLMSLLPGQRRKADAEKSAAPDSKQPGSK